MLAPSSLLKLGIATYNQRSDNEDQPDEQKIHAFTHVVDSSYETNRATQRPLWNEDKKCRNRQGFPEKSLIWQAQDAPVF